MSDRKMRITSDRRKHRNDVSTKTNKSRSSVIHEENGLYNSDPESDPLPLKRERCGEPSRQILKHPRNSSNPHASGSESSESDSSDFSDFSPGSRAAHLARKDQSIRDKLQDIERKKLLYGNQLNQITKAITQLTDVSSTLEMTKRVSEKERVKLQSSLQWTTSIIGQIDKYRTGVELLDNYGDQLGEILNLVRSLAKITQWVEMDYEKGRRPYKN